MVFIKQKAKNEKLKTFQLKILRVWPFRFGLLVCITSLTVLLFAAGCQQAEPERIEPAPAKNVKLDRTEVDSVKIEIVKPEQPKIAPEKSKPSLLASLYEKYAEILKEYVSNDGMVNYRMLKLKKVELTQTMDELAKLDPNIYNEWPKEDKIAFWLNEYNIQILRIIIDNYPVESSRLYRVLWPPTSIRHIPPVTEIGVSKWNGYKFMVMDEVFTLEEIERQFFRKQFAEPRALFATSFASLSGPPLRSEPYYGEKLYKQLDDQVKRFLSSPRAFKIDREKQIVYLSAMFEPDWYGQDFINRYAIDKKFKDKQPAVRAVLNFLTNYISEQDASFLEIGNYTVKYINYDWRLNE